MSRWLVLLMAVASGAAVANLCYAQPLLSIMARDLACEKSLVAYVPGLTLTGYAFGMLLFGPLGDLFERRKLIVTMLLITGVACLAVALSPNIGFLWVASLLLGFVTISAQLLIPFAAHLAPHSSRGRTVGTVMSGLLIGLLMARDLLAGGGIDADFCGDHVACATALRTATGDHVSAPDPLDLRARARASDHRPLRADRGHVQRRDQRVLGDTGFSARGTALRLRQLCRGTLWFSGRGGRVDCAGYRLLG
jgi:hypothetical protein